MNSSGRPSNAAATRRPEELHADSPGTTSSVGRYPLRGIEALFRLTCGNPEGETTMAEQKLRCFACDHVIRRKVPYQVDTRDAQIVFVGPECFRLVIAAGELGYQPPKGGPRLFPLKNSQ